MSAKKAGLGAIFLTVLIDLLGFGLVLPFLGEEARDTFHSSEFTGSLLAASYSLMQFLFVPVWGRLSDRVGRRPVLLWSVFASSLGMLSLGLALGFGQSVALLFVARMFSGVATANLGTASAYIADVTKPEERARGMALFGIAFGLGFVLGPALGGVLAEIQVNGRSGVVPCLVAAGLSLINVVWTYFGVAESLPKERRAQSTRSLRPLDLVNVRRTLARPDLGRAVLVNFVTIASFTLLEQTFRYFTKDLFQMTQRDTGWVLAGIGVTAALVQGGVVRPLAKRVRDLSMLRVGLAIQVVGFAVLVFTPDLGIAALWTGAMTMAVGNGLSQPSGSAYLSRQAAAHEQGEVLGTNQSFSSLARMLGPALGGYLYSASSMRSPYLAGALGMAIALLLALRLRAATPPDASSPSAALEQGRER